MMKYDVILVGGGIANVMAALRLANTDKKVLLLEQGKDIYHRMCPKAKLGKCVNCKPCQITTGFGGAGFFSDCKLTYTHEVGGDVADYIGKDKFYELLKDVGDTFTQFGGQDVVVYNEEYANKLQYDCSKYGLKLIKSPTRHLGTDGAYEVMKNIYATLLNASNIEIKCNTKVCHIDFKGKYVTYMPGQEIVYADNIVVAVGRYGSEWLANQCKEQGIKVSTGNVDIGVRVECPRAVTDPITDNLYEMKIIYNSSTGNTCRTFCVNPGGYVVRENYDDIACVNGHSLSDNKSLNTNFAILVSCHFTEPFNEPIEYGKMICRLSNMLSDGKPMVQRLEDLQACKRSTKDRIKRLVIDPSLTDAEPGDLRYVLPSNIIDSIIEFIEKLDNVMPGINGKGTVLYAPECKFSSSKIELNNNLQPEGFDGIYFAGDSAGISRGIMQASIAGTYIADHILAEDK